MAEGSILMSHYDPGSDSWFMLVKFSAEDYSDFNLSGIASLTRRRSYVRDKDAAVYRRALAVSELIKEAEQGER